MDVSAVFSYQKFLMLQFRQCAVKLAFYLIHSAQKERGTLNRVPLGIYSRYSQDIQSISSGTQSRIGTIVFGLQTACHIDLLSTAKIVCVTECHW